MLELFRFSLFLTMIVFITFCWQAGGCDLAALTYLRRWRSFTMIGSKNTELNQTVGQGGTTKAVSMFRLEKSQIMFPTTMHFLFSAL